MGSGIKVLIVDDEPLARDNIRILLGNDAEIEFIAEARNGSEAAEILRENNTDLMFLDIQMPGMNGFEMLSTLSDIEMPVIIFVTAYDNYALQAFQVHAIDYLLKPYSDESFFRALNSAKQYIKYKQTYKIDKQLKELLKEFSGAEPAVKSPSKYIQRIAVSVNNKTILIKTDDVDWIESADYYVKVHSCGKSYLLRESMNKLEEQLDPDKFIRIHRSSIVNMERIKEIEALFNGESIVTLSEGTKLRLSKSRKKSLKEKLKINLD